MDELDAQRPGEEPEKMTERPNSPLLKLAFIARDGVRPADTRRWYDFDWNITDTGHAWLTANVTPA